MSEIKEKKQKRQRRQRKTNFKTMLKIFDDLWENHGKNNVSFLDGWSKALENHRWTEKDFDEQLSDEFFNKDKAA